MSLRTRSRQRRDRTIYLFVLPALALVVTFAYLPAGSAFYHSFFSWKGGDVKEFIGFGNFLRAWHDPVLARSFETVLILMAFNVLKLVPSVLLAVLIHRLRSDRWQYAYRALLVVPMIIPGLVTLFIWKFFFDPHLGALNRVLDVTGLKGFLVWLDQSVFHWNVFFADVPVGWLSQPELVLPSLFIWGFPWIGTVGVLIFLSGLQAIPTEVYEAAEIDGIGPWGKFLRIELPLILTQIRLSLVLLIVATLQNYGLQLMLLSESGGPAGRGMVPGLWMYNRAFIAGEFGYACAIGLILFVFIVTLTVVNQRYVRIEK